MKDEQAIEVSVVMPCLNEEETLETCIKKAKAAFKKLNISGEVIIGDNGSTDKSIEIARTNGARVVHQHLKGYGNALRCGIEAASGKYVIMGDADDSYDFGELGKFVEKLREGYDLVMGCRLPSGGGTIKPNAMPWLHRWIGNPVLSKIGRMFFNINITDFHCGLRGFSKRAYKRMKLSTTGMEFASEMVIKSKLADLKLTEVPITLHQDGRSRPPHLRSWRDGWRHLRFMLLYSTRWLFLYPSLALLLFGLITLAVLIPGPLTIHGVNFDTNTMLIGSLSIILGVQVFSFALSARIYAASEGFLPVDPKIEKYRQYSTLEFGIGLGIIFTLIGFGAIFFILFLWSELQFGDLNRADVLRIIIPGITAIVVGVQIIFSSFFLSYLNLKRS